MKQNTKTILLTIFACLVLITGFEIGSGRIRFGNAYFNDSTALYITSNKGLIVNGPVKTSDSLILTDYQAIIWDGLTDLNIVGYGGVIESYATQYINKTTYGTSLSQLDSNSGFARYISGAQAYGSTLVYEKVIKGVTASAVNGTQTYAHGITNGRIISWDCFVRVDTAGVSGYGNDYLIKPYANTYMGAGYQYTAYVDSLNVGTMLGGTADAIKGDSVFFLIRYIP